MQQTDRGWSDPGHTANMQGMVQLVEIGLSEVCRLTSGYPWHVEPISLLPL